MPAPMSLPPGNYSPDDLALMLSQAQSVDRNSPVGLDSYLQAPSAPPEYLAQNAPMASGTPWFMQGMNPLAGGGAPAGSANPAPADAITPVAAGDAAAKQLPLQDMKYGAYLNPNNKLEQEQLKAYSTMAKQSLADQGAGLGKLQTYIDQMAGKPRDINWTPLAAYIDSQNPGSHMVEAAKALAPMTDEEHDQMLYGLQQKLQAGRAQMSKEQLDALSEQIKMLQSQDQRSMMAAHYANEDAANAQRSGSYNGRIALGQDNQASMAVRRIHTDQPIIQMRQQATNVAKGQELLTSPEHVPTYTEVNEVAQDLSAALSGKMVASDYKLKEISTPAVQTEIAKLKGYMESNPNQPAPPEVIKFWSQLANRLGDVYDRQLGARAQGLLSGLQTAYAHNPTAYKAAQEAASIYKSGAWKNDPTLTDGSTGHISAKPPAAIAASPNPVSGGGIQVGTVDQGRDGTSYKFKGGDPSNKANWEKVGG